MHRRLVALVVCIASLMGFVFLLSGALYSALSLTGVDIATENNPDPLPLRDAIWFGLFGFIGALMS
jgi:hypothetical protein